MDTRQLRPAERPSISSSTSRAPANRRALVDDPVALQVIWTWLIAIADEAAVPRSPERWSVGARCDKMG
jgi:hypothetical protein